MQNSEIAVLIVEDEAPIQAVLRDVLSPQYDCWCADSASSAMRLMETHSFHVALVDTGLPGMSGVSLCRLIVNRSPKTSVIIVSGNSDSRSIEQAMKAGAVEYVTKPFDLSRIEATVERVVKRHLPESAA